MRVLFGHSIFVHQRTVLSHVQHKISNKSLRKRLLLCHHRATKSVVCGGQSFLAMPIIIWDNDSKAIPKAN